MSGTEQSISCFFLYRDSYQGKISSKSTTVGWEGPDMPSTAQTCLILAGHDFGWSGVA